MNDMVTNRRNIWDPVVLNYAVQELLKDFPRMRRERVVGAVNLAAQDTKPSTGSVALLHLARERLREMVRGFPGAGGWMGR